MEEQALHKLSYGVYLIGSAFSDKVNGQTATAVMQISAEPPTVALSINKQNLTHQYLDEGKVFSVSVLAKEAPLKLIGQFGFKSGRDEDKLAGINWKKGLTGAPLFLDNTVAALEGEIIGNFDCGTHTIFLGKVTGGEVLSPAEPMTYAYYHEVKRGTSPETAPTYIRSEDKRRQK